MSKSLEYDWMLLQLVNVHYDFSLDSRYLRAQLEACDEDKRHEICMEVVKVLAKSAVKDDNILLELLSVNPLEYTGMANHGFNQDIAHTWLNEFMSRMMGPEYATETLGEDGKERRVLLGNILEDKGFCERFVHYLIEIDRVMVPESDAKSLDEYKRIILEDMRGLYVNYSNSAQTSSPGSQQRFQDACNCNFAIAASILSYSKMCSFVYIGISPSVTNEEKNYSVLHALCSDLYKRDVITDYFQSGKKFGLKGDKHAQMCKLFSQKTVKVEDQIKLLDLLLRMQMLTEEDLEYEVNGLTAIDCLRQEARQVRDDRMKQGAEKKLEMLNRFCSLADKGRSSTYTKEAIMAIKAELSKPLKGVDEPVAVGWFSARSEACAIL